MFCENKNIKILFLLEKWRWIPLGDSFQSVASSVQVMTWTSTRILFFLNSEKI